MAGLLNPQSSEFRFFKHHIFVVYLVHVMVHLVAVLACSKSGLGFNKAEKSKKKIVKNLRKKWRLLCLRRVQRERG